MIRPNNREELNTLAHNATVVLAVDVLLSKPKINYDCDLHKL